MGVNCSHCGKAMRKAIGNHHYLESGLNNVYLENIPMYECPDCRIAYPSIFRLGRLNDLIALSLVQKPALLNGREIRFLRKNLRMPSQIFARQLGVDKTTLSKWENDLQKHSEGNDRLIRTTYVLEKRVMREEQQTIQKFLKTASLKDSNSQYMIIAEKVKNDYKPKYRPVVENMTQASSMDTLHLIENKSFAGGGTILGFKIMPGNVEAFSNHAWGAAVTALRKISEGSTPYGTQAAQI